MPPGVDDSDRAERIAQLKRRAEALLEELAERRRTAAARATEPDGTVRLAPTTPAGPAANGFKRMPEAILAVIGLLGLWWFLPITFLSNLSPEATVGVVAAIPFLLVIFVFGGAAVWRVFRER